MLVRNLCVLLPSLVVAIETHHEDGSASSMVRKHSVAASQRVMMDVDSAGNTRIMRNADVESAGEEVEEDEEVSHMQSGPGEAEIELDVHDEYEKVWQHMKSVFGVENALARVQRAGSDSLMDRGDGPGNDSPGGTASEAKLDSDEVKQSVLFAQNEINEEREMLCPDAKSLTLKATKATAQVDAGVVIDFSFTVDASSAAAKASVIWETSGSPSGTEVVALQRLKNKFGHIVGDRAQLRLSTAACALDGTVKVPALGQEFQAFKTADADQYSFGLIMDKEIEEYEAAEKSNVTIDTPGSFNLKSTQSRCIDYVHDQGKCGSCYMFASIDSLSDRHCIHGRSGLGYDNQLSVMQALLCESSGRQCSGGWASTGFNYAVHGVDTWQKWPYSTGCLSTTPCKFGDHCSSAGDDLSKTTSNKCTGSGAFFSIEEGRAIVTHGDAAKVAKKKCVAAFTAAGVSSTASGQTCAEWVEDRFLNLGQADVFAPTTHFCSTLKKDMQALAGKSGTSLIQEFESPQIHDTLANEGASSLSQELESRREAGERSLDLDGTVSRKGGRRRRRRRDPDDACDRNRCGSQARPHGLTRYHAVSRNFASFKSEIYSEGPIYFAFKVMEDFQWFFKGWKSHSYNHQFGAQSGGHAVVAIGWMQGCTHHTGKSLMEHDQPALLALAQDDPAVWRKKPLVVQRRVGVLTQKVDENATLAAEVKEYLTAASLAEEDTAVSEDESEETSLRSLITARANQNPSGLPVKDAIMLDRAVTGKGDRRRRRQAKGDCLYLRNSWGGGWGDGGYFRLRADNLGGVSLSAYAGDGPH